MNMPRLWRNVSALAAVVAASAAAFVAAPGCNRDGGKTLKFAFVTNNASEFWKIAAAGVRKYEAEGKVQVKDLKVGAELAAIAKDDRDAYLRKQAEAQISVAEDRIAETLRELLARRS